MSSVGLYEEAIRVQDSSGFVLDRRNQMRFNPLAPNGVVTEVTLTGSAFTALTVPTGAKVAFVFLRNAGAVSLTLKGINADQGVPLLPATSPAGWDLKIPLNTGTLGFLNSGASQTIEVLYL